MSDRKERNRVNQRRRRQKLLRIDYAPVGEARQIIETESTRQGKDWCVSSFLDAAVKMFANVNKR